jgi:hypothetical protein
MSKSNSLFECQYQLGLGVHYHMRRQSYFDAWHRITSALSLIFSTSAVAVFTDKTSLGAMLIAVVAIVQCIDLIVDTRGKATLHNDLRSKYLMLEHELLGYGVKLTEDQSQTIMMKIKTIEIHEPPVRKLLLEVCSNDVARRLGCKLSDLIAIGWFKRNTANMFNWPSAKEAEEAKEAKKLKGNSVV